MTSRKDRLVDGYRQAHADIIMISRRDNAVAVRPLTTRGTLVIVKFFPLFVSRFYVQTFNGARTPRPRNALLEENKNKLIFSHTLARGCRKLCKFPFYIITRAKTIRETRESRCESPSYRYCRFKTYASSAFDFVAVSITFKCITRIKFYNTARAYASVYNRLLSKRV